MPTKVGDIFVRANLDDKQYKKGLKGLDATSGAFAKSIAKKLSVAGAIAGLGMFAKKATEAGASLNAMGTIIDASLPHMTKQVDDFAKSAGSMFGLSETQAKGFVGKFASMASAMGYTEKQAYNMSTALTGLAGDVASYYHISADDAYAKLGAVFTGETESLKQLGVVMTQNALDQFALQQGFGKTTQQMTELEKTTLRYQFVLDRLKLANGDFAKYSNTWSGSLATLKLNWSNFMATVGQGLINVLLPLLQVVAKLSQALTVLGTKFLSWTQKVMGIKKGSQQTQAVMEDTAVSATNLGEGFDTTSDNAKSAKKQIQALRRELLGFDKITKLSKQDESTGTSGDVGTGAVSAPITAGGVDFSQADSDVKGFSERAQNYLDKIKLHPKLYKALTSLNKAFKGLFDTIGKAGKWAWDNVLKPLGKWTIDNLLPAQLNVLTGLLKLINSLLKFLGELLKPLFTYVLKPLFQLIGNLWVKYLNNLGASFTKMSKALDIATESVKVFKKWAEGLTIKLKDEFSAKWKGIKSTWQNLRDKKATFTVGLNDYFSSKWRKIKDWWNGITSRSATFTVNFTAWVSKAWNNIAERINDAKDRHPKLLRFIPYIPYLAQGGFVDRNTPQLAVIGDNKREGEIVSPESKLQEMADKASQGSNQEVVRLLTQLISVVQGIDPNVYLDGEQIKTNVVRRINNHTRATGQLEIIV
jgi:hypothetical protein